MSTAKPQTDTVFRLKRVTKPGVIGKAWQVFDAGALLRQGWEAFVYADLGTYQATITFFGPSDGEEREFTFEDVEVRSEVLSQNLDDAIAAAQEEGVFELGDEAYRLIEYLTGAGFCPVFDSLEAFQAAYPGETPQVSLVADPAPGEDDAP